MLTGLQHRGRDVPGRGAEGDQSDQGVEAAAHAQQLGVGGHGGVGINTRRNIS